MGRLLNPDEVEALMGGENLAPQFEARPEPETPVKRIPFKITIELGDKRVFVAEAGRGAYVPNGIFATGTWARYLDGAYVEVGDDLVDRLFPWENINSIEFDTQEFRESIRAAKLDEIKDTIEKIEEPPQVPTPGAEVTSDGTDPRD